MITNQTKTFDLYFSTVLKFDQYRTVESRQLHLFNILILKSIKIRLSKIATSDLLQRRLSVALPFSGAWTQLSHAALTRKISLVKKIKEQPVYEVTLLLAQASMIN